MPSSDYLVWIDLEMTGLKPDTDVIIEMATIVTDVDLNLVAEGPVIAIHQPPEVLDAMDEWNKRTHGASGLIERVRSSTYTMASAEKRTLESLTVLVEPNSSPMCGNSICQDRRFLARHMPTLEKFFHYRNLDVSTLKELARRWAPSIIPRLLEAGRTQGARRHPGIHPRARVLPRAHVRSRPNTHEAVTALARILRCRGGGGAHRAARRAHAGHAFGGVRCARRTRRCSSSARTCRPAAHSNIAAR